MYWTLKTPICTFIIIPNEDRFALYVNSELLQMAATPDALADNVFTHTSEYFDWDSSDYDVEDSLAAWEFFSN